jgi:glycosyltransferase involved in cell wall biosynthesis
MRGKSSMQKRRENSPLMPDVGVVALIADDWNISWRRRHQILTRLARYFHVMWVSPAPEWRQMLRSTSQPVPNFTDSLLPPGFSVYAPESFPPQIYWPRWLGGLAQRLRFSRARRMLVQRGCERIILYICRPDFGSAVASVPHDVSCYHIDDEYSFSKVDLPLDPIESQLIRAVDQVIVHSRGLLEKKGLLNPHVALVPNGVDYQAYAQPQPEPQDLSPIPHPRIGYTGLLKNQLDWPLICNLILRHREWSYVFVGPQAPHPDAAETIRLLASRPNVYFLGAKSVEELSSYPQHFDVCIMPYCLDGYTKYIYPLKLHEFLASGRPVVGTPIRSVQEFSHIITIADTPDAWSIALTDSLSVAANRSERVDARRSVARQHDWNILVRQVARILAERLGTTYLDRFEKGAPELDSALLLSPLATRRRPTVSSLSPHPPKPLRE